MPDRNMNFADIHPWFFDLDYVRGRYEEAQSLSNERLLAEILDPSNPTPFSPNVLFDDIHCRTVCGQDSGTENGVLQYLQVGLPRGVSPNPIFDPAFYLSRHVHLPQDPVVAIRDCLSRLREGADLSAVHPFIDEAYLRHQQELSTPNGFHNALFSGAFFVERPHPLVDLGYLGRQLDQRFENYRDTFAAYWMAEEDVSTHVLFDLDFYRAQLGEDHGIKRAVYHYLVSDGAHSPQPLFDPDFYVKDAEDRFEITPQRPFEHYITHGQQAGLNPSAFFETEHYRARIGECDVPLEHFLQGGHSSATGLSIVRFAQSQLHAQASANTGLAMETLLATRPEMVPSQVIPEFDPVYWKNQNKGDLATQEEPAAIRDHYLRHGNPKQRPPNGLINVKYIAEQLAFLGVDDESPVKAYFQRGWHLRRRVMFALDNLDDTAINRTLSAALRLQLGALGLDVVIVTRASGALSREFSNCAHIWHLPPKNQKGYEAHLRNSLARLRQALSGNLPEIAFFQTDQDLSLLEVLHDLAGKNVVFSKMWPEPDSEDAAQLLEKHVDHVLTSQAGQDGGPKSLPGGISASSTLGYTTGVLLGARQAQKPPSRVEMRERLGVASDAFVVAGQGPFSLDSGIDFFGVIGAKFRTEWACERDVHFIWAGDGPTYANTAHFYGTYFAELSDQSEVFTTVKDMDLAEVLAASDVFLDTKRGGGDANVRAYAQNLGLATISISGARGDIQPGGEAAICSPFALPEIVSRLKGLAEQVENDLAIDQQDFPKIKPVMAFLSELNHCSSALSLQEPFLKQLLFSPPQRVLVIAGASVAKVLADLDAERETKLPTGPIRFTRHQLMTSPLSMGAKAALHVDGATEYNVRGLSAGLSVQDIASFDRVLWVLDGVQSELAEIYNFADLTDEILVANADIISEMAALNPRIADRMRFQEGLTSC
ncbi:hypothetical protein [Pelagimonas phthalicica]|nr:hypothetical protein [Pelagimonas phthalicica]